MKFSKRYSHSVARMHQATLLAGLAAFAAVTIKPTTILGQSSPILAEAPAATKPVESKFLRIKKDDQGTPLTMQTSIARYRPAEGDLIVDLIGAVHVGEAEYYKRLNKQFELYDVVLYELVAPQGTRVPNGGKKKSTGSPLDVVSWMQQQAQSTLGLESQLSKVDYQKANFVHADLSPTEMGEKMAERGDTPLTVGLSAFAEMMRQQNRMAKAAAESGDNTAMANMTGADMLDLLGQPLELKRMMANQFTVSGVLETGLGDTLNQLLITDRNSAAMKVLQREIASGKKKIGIFYGAAHMSDFEKRFASDLGLQPARHVWLDAWDLTQAGKSPLKGGTTGMMLKLLKQMAE